MAAGALEVCVVLLLSVSLSLFLRLLYLWSPALDLSPVSGLVDLKSLPSLFLFHCVYYVCCVTSDASFPSSYGKKHEFIDPLCASFLLLCNKLP